MQQPFDYNGYMRYAWWNYYQSQAYQAWMKHMESIPVYQPLYSDPVWTYTNQDKWNSIMISPSSKTNESKELDQDFDWAISKINQINEKKDVKAASRAAERAAKKAEKKRERNRIRNQRKKEARREEKAARAEHIEQLQQLDTFGKRYKGKSFGQGWAREKNNK